MRFFNSLQLAGLFAAWPMILNWLYGAEFAGAMPLFYVACVAYLLGFIGITSAIYYSIDHG